MFRFDRSGVRVLQPWLCLAVPAFLALTSAGCGADLDGALATGVSEIEGVASAIGNVYPHPHNMTLSKRQYTWSIQKGADGWYAPQVSWIIKQPLEIVRDANTRIGFIPADASLTATAEGYTLVRPARLTNAYVESLMSAAVSAWASVTNIQFREIVGSADVMFSFPTRDDSQSAAEGSCGFVLSGGQIAGASIKINMMLTKPVGYAPFWEAGDFIPQFLGTGYENHLLRMGMHEFGHFLGLAHAFEDTTKYGRDANGATRLCNGQVCQDPPSPDDLSIMDYNLGSSPVLLSAYDITIVQGKYGAPKYSPFIELFIPSMNEHFYTRSWPEANHLLHSGYAGGVRFTHLTGALYTASQTNSTPIQRFYDPNTNKHSYTFGGSTSRPGLSYEGRMGYASNASGTGLSRLGAYHVPSSPDDQFFTLSDQLPNGTIDTGRRYGYVFPMREIGRY